MPMRRHSGGAGGVSPPPAQRSDEATSLSDLIAGRKARFGPTGSTGREGITETARRMHWNFPLFAAKWPSGCPEAGLRPIESRSRRTCTLGRSLLRLQGLNRRARFDAGVDPLDPAPALRAVEELLETTKLAVSGRGFEPCLYAGFETFDMPAQRRSRRDAEDQRPAKSSSSAPAYPLDIIGSPMHRRSQLDPVDRVRTVRHVRGLQRGALHGAARRCQAARTAADAHQLPEGALGQHSRPL